MKHIIIDGYNLLNSPNLEFPSHLNLEGKRNHLISLIQEYARREGSEIIVVFDSSENIRVKSSPDGSVKVRFSPPDKEADDVIKEMIRKTPNPQNLTIISSDRAIQFTARSHGCRCLSSWYFATMLVSSDEKNAPDSDFPATNKHDPQLSDNEIEMWKRLFEQDSTDE